MLSYFSILEYYDATRIRMLGMSVRVNDISASIATTKDVGKMQCTSAAPHTLTVPTPPSYCTVAVPTLVVLCSLTV